MRLDDIPITFIGHPWAPIGMGEQMRSHLAAASAVHLHHRAFDIFRYAQRADPAHAAVLENLERDDVPGGIRIFHINGDEVDRVIEAFEARGGRFADGTNIIVPAWELPQYPPIWRDALRRFDEVWAISRFTQAALAHAGIASHLVGQAVEAPAMSLLPRRHFGIRESAFVLLNFFDLSSYASRKNPEAVLALLARLRAAHPFRDLQLVLKAKNGERDAAEWAAGIAQDPQIKVIATPLDTLGVRSLMNASDCFVSLHRSEGFGRGLGEAMALGRLAMGTAWSGNLDFMTADNALLVNHTMRKLRAGDYPHGAGQRWAEPDVAHAAALLAPVIDDPARGAARAQRGQIEVLRSHGNRAVGVRMLARLEAIAAGLAQPAAKPVSRSTPRSRAKPRK
jgi:hypothetical protein